MSFDNLLDITKICRVCMRSDRFLCRIFDEKCSTIEDNRNLAKMLMECTDYSVTANDALPHQICVVCKSAVRDAFRFKRECEESYRQLCSLLKLAPEESKSLGELRIRTKNCANIKTEYNMHQATNRMLHTTTQTPEYRLFACAHCVAQRNAIACNFCHNKLEAHIVESFGKPTAGFSVESDNSSKCSTAEFESNQCPICRRQFTGKEQMRRHLATIHQIVETVSDSGDEIVAPTSSHMQSIKRTKNVKHSTDDALADAELVEYDYKLLKLEEDEERCAQSANTLELDLQHHQEEEQHDNIKQYPNKKKTTLTKVIKDQQENSLHNGDTTIAAVQGTFIEVVLESSNQKSVKVNQTPTVLEYSNENDDVVDVDNDDNNQNDDLTYELEDEPMQEEYIDEVKAEPSINATKFPRRGKSSIRARRSHFKEQQHKQTADVAATVEEPAANHCDEQLQYNEQEPKTGTPSSLQTTTVTRMSSPHLDAALSAEADDENSLGSKSSDSTTEETRCQICHIDFPTHAQLALHHQRLHEKPSKPGAKIHQCNMCEKKFTTRLYLLRHLTQHDKKRYVCKECSTFYLNKEELHAHIKEQGHDKPMLCPECGLRCKTRNILTVHMRRHNGEKPFKCKFCSKGFPRIDDLRVHEKYHTGEKSHFCETCGKGFQRKYNLTIHLRVHTGERPYKCPHCPQAFAQCNDLKAHIRRHTGERFRCEICDAAFLQSYQIRQHKLTVHGIKEEPPTQRVAKFTSPEAQAQQIQLNLHKEMQ